MSLLTEPLLCPVWRGAQLVCNARPAWLPHSAIVYMRTALLPPANSACPLNTIATARPSPTLLQTTEAHTMASTSASNTIRARIKLRAPTKAPTKAPTERSPTMANPHDQQHMHLQIDPSYYRSGELSDVTVRYGHGADARQRELHKVVLCSQSEFFKLMLSTPMKVRIPLLLPSVALTLMLARHRSLTRTWSLSTRTLP